MTASMSLRTQLACAFGGLLLILLVVGALSVAVLTRYSRALERAFSENYRSALYCEGMKASLERLDARARRLIWQDEAPAPPAAVAAAAEQARFEDNLGRQLRNCTLEGERQLTEQVAQLWREYKSRYGEFEAAGAGRSELYRRDLLPRYTELKEVAGRVADMNMSNMASVDGRVKRTLIEVRDAVLVLVGAGALLAVALVATVGATVLKPLGALTRAARRIEGGDLGPGPDSPAAVARPRDEIGQLVEAFSAMASRLREYRKLDHERLLRTQQTTQLAIDSLPDAVFVISPAGQIEISNRTARDHFGIGPGATVQGLGLRWLTEIYEAVIGGHRPFEPAGYKSALRLFSDGEERFLLPRAVPMLDADHRPVGATVILADVTRLRHEDELKNGLVSTVSHELRTPLTGIRMSVMLLLDEKFGGLAPKQQRLLDAARDDSERLHAIIENLLNLSRIESGNAPPQPEPVGAAELIEQALAPLRDAFAQRGLSVEEHVAPGTPPALADPEGVGLALTNLLSNAMKFTPPGGTVRVGAEDGGESVAFTVADTGPGIPPEYARRIFDRFFRIPRKGGPTGAGLGLAIAKEVVEAQGGRIEFLPREGGGSVFRFTLPRAEGFTAETQRSQREEGRG